MRNSPYVPCGFTQAEVAHAARNLPRPSSEFNAAIGRSYRMAVPECRTVSAYTEGCPHYDYRCESMTCNGCVHGACRGINATCRMRSLEFELNSALDYRTDTIIYWWTLVGAS